MWTGRWTIRTNTNPLVIKDLGKYLLMHQALCSGWNSGTQHVLSLGTANRRNWASSEQSSQASKRGLGGKSVSSTAVTGLPRAGEVRANREEDLLLGSGCTTATFSKYPMVPVLTKQLWKSIHHSDRTQGASPHTEVLSGLSFGDLKGVVTLKELGKPL